jgi:autotransporter-associated beta strand protein
MRDVMRHFRNSAISVVGGSVSLLALICSFSVASAVTVTWTGASSSDFNAPSNWGGTTPEGNSVVFYQAGAVNYSAIDVSADVTVTAFSINSTATDPITINSVGGHAIFLGGNMTIDAAAGPLTINSGFVVQRTSTETWAVNGTSSVTINGIVSSQIPVGYTRLHDVNKTGSGTLTLNGVNTLGDSSNNFGLRGGRINVGNAAAFGNYELNFATASSSFDNSSGAPMTLANNNRAIVSSTNLTATFVGSNDLNMGTGGMGLNFNNGKFTLNVLASNLTFGGAITGNMDLVKNGAGTLTLNGANTFGGIASNKGFTLSGGKVNLGNATALGAGVVAFNNLGVATTIDNTSGAALTLTNNNPIAIYGSTLTFLGTENLDLGTGAVTLTSADSNLEIVAKQLSIGGAISGAQGLIKSGAGTLILSGANAFTGATTVSAGILVLNTALGGGTISGSPTIQVNNGATLDVSNHAGGFGLGQTAPQILKGDGSVLGSVGFVAGSALAVDYNGSAIDSLAISGDLNITNATVDFNGLGGSLTAGAHVFASYGSLTGSSFANIVDLPTGFTIDYNYLGGNQMALVGALPPVPGDFDADGDVDGADFVAWQTHFPTATGATLADGDADGDDDVDGADFVVWQTNFPFTPGPGASPIPEPANFILASLGIIGGGMLRRSRRR